MFYKLVSNLPFSPSSIEQVSFYYKRLKREESIRKAGFVLLILGMAVQIFAAVAPAEKSLAHSDNHIINGVKTRDDILRAWDRPGSDIPRIYGKLGVTRQDIANLPKHPNSTVRSDRNNYWSIGRNSLSGYTDIEQRYKNQEIALEADGTTFYARPLHAWDTRAPYTSYKAFKGRNSTTGKTFWILVDCGNYTQVDKPSIKNPGLQIKKTISPRKNQFKPGETFKYRIEYRNKVRNSLAEDVKIVDQIDTKNLEVLGPNNLSIRGGKLNQRVGNLRYTNNKKILDITVRIKDSAASGTVICNTASLTAKNADTVSSGGSPQTCIRVVKTCPNNPGIIDEGNNCHEPTATCEVTESNFNRSTNEATLLTTTSVSDPAKVQIKSYKYDFGDGTVETHQSASTQHSRKHIYQPGAYTATVAVQYSINGASNSSRSAACTSAIEVSPTPTDDSPPSQSKKVKNITHNLSGKEAENSLLRAGDVVEYSLITTNTGNSAVEHYDVSDYVGDILDYADIDTSYLESQGGSYDSTSKQVLWKNQTLPANDDVAKTFRVVMKNPVPSTNSPSTVSTNFDCKISNQYGDELILEVQCPTLKTVEQLPNTGPGTTIAIAFTVSATSGYFLARSRLLAKELGLIKKNQYSI